MPKTAISHEFGMGQKVYLITDGDQLERKVTAITVFINKSMWYTLACGTESTDHFEEEICADKNVI